MLDEIELKRLNEKIHSGERAGALRAVAVHMVAHLGHTQCETAEMLMIHETTISDWIKSYRRNGAAGLDNSPRPGRPPHIPHERIEGMLTDRKTIDIHEFTDMLENRFGVTYEISYARRLLRRIGFSIKKRRSIATGTPPQDVVEKWQIDARKVIEKHEMEGYTVLTIDESHQKTTLFGTGSVYTRGEPEVIASPIVGSTVSVFGALSLDGESFCMEADKANSGTTISFFEELEKKCEKVLLILDNAPYHKSQMVRDYVESHNGNLKLYFLPPYSPFLNPAEAIWKYGKRAIRQMRPPPPGESRQCIMSVYNLYECGFNPRNILFRNVGRLYPS